MEEEAGKVGGAHKMEAEGVAGGVHVKSCTYTVHAQVWQEGCHSKA